MLRQSIRTSISLHTLVLVPLTSFEIDFNAAGLASGLVGVCTGRKWVGTMGCGRET
jgi:hypothetical protein